MSSFSPHPLQYKYLNYMPRSTDEKKAKLGCWKQNTKQWAARPNTQVLHSPRGAAGLSRADAAPTASERKPVPRTTGLENGLSGTFGGKKKRKTFKGLFIGLIKVPFEYPSIKQSVKKSAQHTRE